MCNDAVQWGDIMRLMRDPLSLIGAILLTGLLYAAAAVMPLGNLPTWESTPNGHYATGGAWADIDGDGWLDLVASNGNDMARQNVVIYHNNGDGTFPMNPTWSSADVDYHGHLDIGDVNRDGLPDVAVAVYIGPAGFDEPGRVKVYLNDGAGAFHTSPDWTSAENFYCFSVAFGDVDGDGDLDLACACGDDYDDHPEHQRIYFNTGDRLEDYPSWQSSELTYALDVSWGDVDDDGDLDVAFCGTSAPMQLYLNAQTAGGGLATVPAWQSTDLPQFGNTTAFGDWNGDGLPELAVADNYQLGGAGRFKVYANAGGMLSTAPVWTSATGGYGSHVSWIDLDLDGDRDLATGRWWSACQIYENTGVFLATQPIWTSSTSSVVENMFWGDVDNDGLRPDGLTIASGDGARTFFSLGHAPAQTIDAVEVDGVPVPQTAYAAHPAQGWVSLGEPAPAGSQNVVIRYTYSLDVDLGVTNWDPTEGNYLFLNTSDTGAVPDIVAAVLELRAAPNPLTQRTWLRYRGEGTTQAQLMICDASGRWVRTLHDGPLAGGLVSWEWDRRDAAGARVASGVYFARFVAGGTTGTVRLIVAQ